MSEAERLAACPFCGGPAVLDPPKGQLGWMAECSNEDCIQAYVNLERTRAEAIAAWNRRTPAAPPPAPEGWRAASEEVLKHWCNYHGDLGSQHPTAAGHLQPHWDKFLLAMEHFEKVFWDTPASPSPPAPARAELARRLRDRAASMEDSDGMSSDTSKLLNEAANALGGGT